MSKGLLISIEGPDGAGKTTVLEALLPRLREVYPAQVVTTREPGGVAIAEQIREVIDEVTDTDERMVLRYRYIHNLTWEQIGDELHADRTTVYRWHNSAVNHVKLPENPIQI